MATQTKLQVIDADAHVIETERTWDYLEPAEQKFRPVLLPNPYDAERQMWSIHGASAGFRFADLSEEQLEELSLKANRDMSTPKAARELDDVALRLHHMDQLGIDVQILHNTMWIEQVTQNPDVEAALCRSWNKWLADVHRQSNGRLRWSCVIPTLSLDEAVNQMRFAKENGSVAVCMRPLEGDRSLTDPYFYPVYEEATNLNMAVAVHIANANPANVNLLRGFPEGFNTMAFALFRVPTIVATYTLLMGEAPKLFPKLRWGIIEASAQWVPWIHHEVARRYEARGLPVPEDMFGERQIYVTCQTDDDIPYVLKYAGPNSIVIGTDYGHTDPSSEIDAISIFRGMDGIDETTRERILSHNPKALYDL